MGRKKKLKKIYITSAAVEVRQTAEMLIHNYIRKNPNCTLNDIYKISPIDEGSTRRVIRKLVLGHKIKQYFVAI